MIPSLPVALLGVGSSELLLVFAVVLILLGPRELPRIARTIGRFMAQLRSVSEEFQDQVMRIEDEAPGRIGAGKTGGKPRGDEPESTAAGSIPVVTDPVPVDQNKDSPHELAG